MGIVEYLRQSYFKRTYDRIFNRTIKLPDNYFNMVGTTNTYTNESDSIMILENGKTRYLTEDERKEFRRNDKI